MRIIALLAAFAVVAAAESEGVDPCKRQPFRGRCPSKNGESPKRSQFVLRYYMRNGECVSYPYGHCASDDTEPQLYRYKEECEDACINPPPANLGSPKEDMDQTYGTVGELPTEAKEVATTQTSSTSTETTTTTQVPLETTALDTTVTSSTTATPPTTTSEELILRSRTEAPSTESSSSTSESDTLVPEIAARAFGAKVVTPSEPVTSTDASSSVAETSTSTELPSTSTSSESNTTTNTTSEQTTKSPETATSTSTTTTTTPTTVEPTTTTTQTPSTQSTTTRRSTSTRTTTSRPTTTTVQTESSSSAQGSTTGAPRTECERRRATASSSTIRGGFVPSCTAQGAFQKLQCEPDGRQCFCVDSKGIEIPNSRTRNGQKPDCDEIQPQQTPKTKECVGNAVRGPCTASQSRWYYDEQEAKCKRFTYSGCGGNGNNYETEAACTHRCAPPPMGLPKCEKGEPLKTKLGVTVNCAKSDCPYGYKCSVVQQSSVCCPENNKIIGLQTSPPNDVCSMPKERGPCDKYELRFYYNAELKECKYFFWGGCEGNGNNFEKVEECESTCGIAKAKDDLPTTSRPSAASSARPLSFRTTQGIRISLGNQTKSEENSPSVQQSQSPTTATSSSPMVTQPRRVMVQEPTASVDSSSPSEASTPSEARHSQATPSMTMHVAQTRAPPVPQMALLEVNRCLHPRDPGNCRGQFIRWYWDNERKICDVFTYTGCQGNGNNYASREECLAICHKEATPVVSNDFSNVCKNDVDAGECNGVFQRFAFDTESGECRPFTYGGCGGNGNNFATLAECRIKCQKVALSPGNLCEHDIEVGECSGVFVRFGYDKSNNDCRQFTYGGCGGNGNNFATIQECRNVCVKKVCNPNPQCDLTRCQIVNNRNGCPFCSCPPTNQPLPPGPGSSQCPEIDADKCKEPCIVINNRKGCKDCVCPSLPGADASPPASFDNTVAAPSPPAHSTTKAPRPVQDPVRPPATPVNVGPPSGPPARGSAPGSSDDRVINRQESVITAQSSQRKQIEIDAKQLLPPPLSAHLQEKCMQPVEPGPCKHFVDRWFFNSEDGTCHPFKYGGCAGNRNHFFSQNECEIHCARFLRIVSDDDDENNDDLEAIPRRAAGVSQIPLREPIGLGKSSAPHLRGSAPSHAAHGKKLAAIPAIHMDTMMSTASVEVSDEEDEEISQPNLHAAMAVAPQTIAGQRVSRITLPTTSSTQAHHTKSSSTRRSTTTTTTTTTEASEASTTTSTAPPSTTGEPSSDSPTTESTTPDSATQQALSTTETVSADQSTPSQSTPTAEESSSSTPVSSTTEASSTQSNDEPSELGFFETTSHPETTDSEEDLIELSNATETASSSSAVESSSNSTTISYSSSTDASASLSSTSPTSNTEESPSTIDLSMIISSTPSLVSTTGSSDSATSDTPSTEASTITTTESTTLHDETLTVEAKTVEVSTPPTGASDDDPENSISSTTDPVSADIDNSITTTKSALSSTTSQKPNGAVLKTPLEINANTVQLSSKFKSDPDPSNEPVEFFDPNDLPPPPPENERRPVLNAAPQFSSQSVKPLKKIEILPIPVKDADPPKSVITETLPKSVVTAAQANIPIETTVGYDFTTESTTPKKPLSDLGESNDPSSLEVSSSEEVEGYPIGREPVPLSPVGIGRNMERLDIEGLEVPTTVVPLVRTSTTEPEEDEDASDFAEIQQSFDTQSVTRRATQTPSTEGSAAPTTRAAATAAPEAEYPTTEIRSTQASTTPAPSTQAATIQEATTAEAPSTQAATTRQSTTTTEEPTTTTVAATTPSTTSPRPTTVSSTPSPTTRPPVTTRSPVTTPPPVTSTVGTRPPAPRTAAPLAVPRGQSELDARVICALPPDAGTCFEYSPRWFFNAQSSQCEQFSYGSCGGNENNFLDRTSCEVKCMASHTAVLSRVPERCTYERDAGTGKGYNVKWYFNMKNLRCEQFVFEGQGGNGNQFETLSDCERLCAPEPASARRTASPPLPAVVQQPAPPAPRERPPTPVVATVPDHVDQTIQDIIDYDEKLSQFAENARAIPPSSPIQNSVDNRVPVAPTATRAPLPPAPHLELPSPGIQPRPPAAQAAKTVVHQEKAQEVTTTTTAKPVVQERRKEIYKAEPLPERPPSTGNEGLPIVGASPPMSVNYQTGEVKNKASGIRTFHESSLRVAVEDSDLTEGSERRRDSLSCPNGIQEIRYADGRPVMCLPGKNQCPDKSVCYFNGMDFFCCPNEEDPYDKHVFGGYDGEETKHGYKVFGPLNIRRLMDDVPLRVRRSVRSSRIRRQSMPETVANTGPVGFNLDSITGPLRFDDEKPRQVSRAQRMRVKPPPPNHGNPICIEPLSQGDCGAAHLRYFYDRDADKCRLFYYTGCKGNNNNFGSLLDCQRLCVLGGQRPSSESATSAPKQIIRGQCPNDKMPLGGSAPVLCGNTTDSIGCPAGFYCLPGPPDVCCPKNAQGDDDEKSSVRFAPEIKSLTRENPRKAHLSTPKFMCPDASDPLMGSAGEPTPCGAGFDGMKLCPKGFYCAIDVEKQTRMCCPLYGAGERVPTEQVIAPYLGRRPSNPGEILERGSLPSDQALFTASGVRLPPAEHSPIRKQLKSQAPETTTSMFEEDSQEFDGEEEEEEGEEGMAHLMLKPADPPQESSTELSTDAPESEHEHAIDLPTEPSPVEEAPVLKEAEDKSICQIRPSEGRACREDEQPPRTNLHYFYSPKDHRCKLYFYRGCGGNANRFEKKADCERLCLN